MLADRDERRRAVRAKGPIAADFEDCQQKFVQLSDALHLSRLRHLVEKCWRRFDVWDDDSGASSRMLDYALKSSPSLEKQTTSLLSDLGRVLGQAILAVPLEELEDEEGGGLESIKPRNDCDTPTLPAETVEDDAEADADFGPAPWLQEAFDIVDNLVHLLPALRNPFKESPPSNAMIHGIGCYSLDSYQQAAEDMFPSANSDLLKRLAQAQWLTRHVLPNTHDNPCVKPDPAKTTSMSRALARQQGWPSRRKISAAQANNRADSDKESSTIRSHVETVLSRTAVVDRYSTTSFGGSSQNRPVRRPSVPNPPVDLGQLGTDHFDCPYCHCELPLAVGAGMSRDDWADHFYQDTKPYICTHGQCNVRDVAFASREEWFRHELDFHRTAPLWMCGFCTTEFRDANQFQSHLQSAHSNLPLPRDLSPLIRSCRRLSHNVVDLECTLCHAICRSLEELKNHVGNHLEAFAIEIAHEHELAADHDEEDEDNRERFLMEFLSDQNKLHEPETGPFGNGNDDNGMRPLAVADAPDTADTNHLADASDLLNNDETNTLGARYMGSDWTEKVNRYLDAQQDNAETVKHNLPAQYENFAGREEDLLRIDEYLSSPGRVCVLTGAPGIGKTATAVQYAHRFGIEYSYIFWVEAEAPGPLADRYASIADALDLSRDGAHEGNRLLFRVTESLLKLDRRWLLIFDNAVTWADISPYITKALTLSKGSVLINTREDPLQSAPRWLHPRRVELGPLSTDHGREFLLTSIHPRVRREDLHEDDDFELAAKTVNILEGLPLSISMVVGYVKETGCALGDFIEMWDEKELRSRKPSKMNMVSAGSVDKTVDSLWDIGIREVPSNSRKLLNIMSFLNPDRIQKSLLVGDHEEDYLDLLNASERRSYQRMINKLSRLRIIDVKEAPNAEIEYSIHRLLQQKIMIDMDDYGIADAFRKTFRLIRKKFPRADPQQVPDPTTWPICQEYMPHIESFHGIFSREQDRIDPLAAVKPLELAELFYDAGFHVWSRRGTAYNGLKLLKTAIGLLDKIEYDRDAKLRADINCMIGLLMLEMGCKERVRGTKHLSEVRRIRKAIYEQNPDDHDTDVLSMNAISDYSLCLLNDHKFDEAGEEMLTCYKRYQVWGTEDENPFEHSKHYGNYSVVLMFQGRMEEAIDSVKQCLQLTRQFSGKKAQWYRRLFLLASIHLQAGNLHEALNLHLRTLKARLELDTNLLHSLYAVGAMYHHLNNLEQATVYMKECVESAMNLQFSRWSREGLGRAQFHLALLYEKQGIEHQKAQELKADARKVLDQYRGFAAECVQNQDDELMIFDDLQPTLLGRYTGTELLKYLQKHLPRRDSL